MLIRKQDKYVRHQAKLDFVARDVRAHVSQLATALTNKQKFLTNTCNQSQYPGVASLFSAIETKLEVKSRKKQSKLMKLMLK